MKKNPPSDPCYSKLHIPPSVEMFPWQSARIDPPTISKGLFPGKWLLFRRCATAVVDWMKICQEISNGNLWSAKVSLTSSGKAERVHLICVYTPDFRNVDEVRSAGILLCKLELAMKNKAMYYKPDVFTQSNIYADSGPASIYSMQTGDSILKKSSGFSRLSKQDRDKIDKAFEALAVSST